MPDGCYYQNAGWSSLVARWAHNPKVGGSNPPPATTYRRFGTHWLPFVAALGTNNTPASLAGQHAPNYHTVRGPLAIRHGMRTDIHRALDGGVPQQFLLDFEVGTHSTQKARVGMAPITHDK